MNDPSLFVSGALFTQDYLIEGVTGSQPYIDVDLDVLRERLATVMSAFPYQSAPNEATTEHDVVWPVLELLGWSSWLTQQNLSGSGRVDVPDGLLFIDEAAKFKANEHPEEWRRYEFGAAVVESKRWGRALDRAEGRSGADRETPSTQLLRYLRRIDDLTSGALRWGILTNGARWRLYYSGARSTIDDYLEIDLSRVLKLDNDLLDTSVTDDDRDHWLRVFAVMFSRAAFERDARDAPSFHERARQESAFYEERVAKNLSDLVFTRLYPALGQALDRAAPAGTDLNAIRSTTLILLYRLLFLLYAEDRGLLPVRDDRYDNYALREARLDVGKRMDAHDTFSSVATQIWSRFASLSQMIDKGDASVGLPPYNGGLFNSAETPLLDSIRLPDDVMAEALDILSWESRGGRRAYINYRDLSVQQLGSIYERLLEFEMRRADGGDLEVLPNIFARKDSGSYYTPDELVLLLIDETLEPLIADAHAAFRGVLASLRPGDSEASKLRALEAADPAKAITRLRVCDPAMGSGHFLVSLVDRLTNHALEAIAQAQVDASNAGVENYQSPVATEIEQIRSTIWTNAQEKRWAIAEEQLDDPQLVKRMVLKRCVHGVDKNPMAVELAKVALWLHTFTVGAPLSFIDHHLHCGDSLFGLWVRDAIDKAGKAGELLYIDDLRNAERQAAVMQRIEALTDAEIAEAHSSAEMWRDIEAQIGPFDSFVSFMHALDWLDLPREDKALVTQWLDGGFGDPLPIARGRKEPEALRAKQDEAERFHAIWRNARQLIEEERFLNWQIAFPGVWQNWASAGREGGFDAIIGNPPWDMMEFEEVPWFEARDREIALETSRAARSRRIAALRDAEAPLWIDYRTAKDRASAALRVARGSGIYDKLNRGRVNLYKLFIERCHSLVQPRGMVGLLTPSGIAADLSTAGFFRSLATGGHIKSLFDFENGRSRYQSGPFFPDIHRSTKFCAMAASPGRKFDETRCGFYLHDVVELADAEAVFPLTADDFARVNPNTGTAPVFRSRNDMRITTAIYEKLPVLLDKGGHEEIAQYQVVFQQMLNMSSDSYKFIEHAGLEAEAWREAGNIYQSPEGRLLPLFEGKMVQAFDHRASDVVLSTGNVFRPGQGQDLTYEEHQDPNRSVEPRYWVKESDVPWGSTYDWCIAFKDITAATNMRTTIAAMIPKAGAGHTLPVAIPAEGADERYLLEAPLLLAAMNSTPFDYLARQKVHGTHLSWYLLDQIPVAPLAVHSRTFGPKTAAEIVREGVLELTYTAHDIAAFARDMGHLDADGEVLPPFTWDEDRRLQLRSKLDALYFILYGIYDPDNAAQSREDIRYIYSTFPIVERHERERWGTYRSRDLALAWINALLAGKPDTEVAG